MADTFKVDDVVSPSMQFPPELFEEFEPNLDRNSKGHVVKVGARITVNWNPNGVPQQSSYEPDMLYKV